MRVALPIVLAFILFLEIFVFECLGAVSDWIHTERTHEDGR
jgi:hypothetical protein